MASSPDLNFDRDPFKGPALGSLVLHAAIFGSLLLYALIAAHLRGNAWGNHNDTQGAIQATMVSSAPAIPLPQDQKPTDQVLATETPSPAPAPPAPRATRAEEQDAIPIPDKQPLKTKLEPKKQVEQPKVAKVPVQHVPLIAATPSREQVRPLNRANYGEAAPAAVARSTAQAAPGQQTTVQGGNFGALYGYYVAVINRKISQNWYLQEVDSSTPAGTKVYLTFSLNRSGEPSRVQVQQSSGSPTLDTSCLRAVQRVDSFGPLPAGYNGSSLLVSYYCQKP